jgi:hypothetical protein
MQQWHGHQSLQFQPNNCLNFLNAWIYFICNMTQAGQWQGRLVTEQGNSSGTSSGASDDFEAVTPAPLDIDATGKPWRIAFVGGRNLKQSFMKMLPPEAEVRGPAVHSVGRNCSSPAAVVTPWHCSRNCKTELGRERICAAELSKEMYC